MQKNSLIPIEISWLSFNARVLQEANDPSVPLKQRIRFLGIHSNNRDEFFRVRVAALKKMIDLADKKNKHYFGRKPQTILDEIQNIVLQQQNDFNRIWKNIQNELKKAKVFLLDEKHLDSKQKDFVREFFNDEVSSAIIPLFIENMPQLPDLGDESIFLGIVMKKKSDHRDQKCAIIEIPTRNFNRFVPLPSKPGIQCFILLEDVIRFNLSSIFSYFGYTSFEAHMFKITKDSEIDVDSDVFTDYVQKIERGVQNRRKAKTIRFLYDKDMHAGLLEFLMRKLNLSHKDTIIPGGRIRNFRDFMDFPAQFPQSEIFHPPFKHPALENSLRVSDVVMQQDILLYFPYHTFNSVIDLLREAAMDPDVKTIKITIYRLASNSKIYNALINAVRNGKQVLVVLELRARFDEEANLRWKAKFEEEGVKVIVGIPKMKVHAKICVIKKIISNQPRYYGFIGTGNLNEKTALSYADHCLMTSHRGIMADLNRVFKALEKPDTYRRQMGLCKFLLVSPLNMRKTLIGLINQEIKEANAGKPAKIIINLNSLSDEKLIKKLYQAADAGVEINMIIRGIFCVGADLEKFTHPITAVSIVDQYLEHSRIWLFHHGGEEKIYLSSADWMVRNLDLRVEVAVPVRDEALKEDLKDILQIKLGDNIKARRLDPNISNRRVPCVGSKNIRSQVVIYEHLRSQCLKKE